MARVTAERLAEIAAIPDAEIDTSDIPEADEAWFFAALPGGRGRARNLTPQLRSEIGRRAAKARWRKKRT